MTVENNCAIAIATLSDCLKNKKKSCACFSSYEIQNPTNLTLYARFFPGFERVTVIARNSDWFIALFAQSCCDWSDDLFWYRFFNSHLKTAPYFKIAFISLKSM